MKYWNVFSTHQRNKYNYHIATTMASSNDMLSRLLFQKYAARKPYALTTNNIAELCNILTNQL